MNKFTAYSNGHRTILQNETKLLAEEWLRDIQAELPVPKYLLPVLSWCGKPGKCMRGTLVLLCNNSFGNNDKKTTLTVAGIVELLQTALLIHDDLMDGSTERRGGPSFHEQISECLAARGHALHQIEGKKIALAVSDHLLQWLNQKIQRLSKNLNLPLLSDIFLRYTIQTMNGQFADASHEEIITDTLIIKDIYAAKTGGYTFCLPLVLGYVLSNSHESITQELILEVIGENLGIVLQSRDDLTGFKASAESLKNLREDLVNHQPSLWIPLLLKQLNPIEINFFKTIWKTQHVTDADLYYLRFLYQKYQIQPFVREQTEIEAKLCHQLITDLNIKSQFRVFWHSLIDHVAEV